HQWQPRSPLHRTLGCLVPPPKAGWPSPPVDLLGPGDRSSPETFRAVRGCPDTTRGRRLSRPGPVRTCASMRLLLASTSPARRALLDALGVRYAVEAPGVDEVVPDGTPVEAAVRMLALRKARAVATRNPGALVLGADQLAEVDGRALGKPATREVARAQL